MTLADVVRPHELFDFVLAAGRGRPGHDVASAMRAAGDSVPPAYCAAVLSRDGALLSTIVDPDSAMTGLPASIVRDGDGKVAFSTAVSGAFLDHLGIDGAGTTPSDAQRSAVRRALTLLAGDDGAHADEHALVRRWVPLVAWLRLSRATKTPFSSTAFPRMNGCVFFSPLVEHHLAPDTTFPSASVYAVAENLVHEALHHELGAAIVVRDIYRPVRRREIAEPSIVVPWRGATLWSHEKALHAYYVYEHLRRFRMRCLDRHTIEPCEEVPVRAALAHAVAASAYLKSALATRARELLGPNGARLFERIATSG